MNLRPLTLGTRIVFGCSVGLLPTAVHAAAPAPGDAPAAKVPADNRDHPAVPAKVDPAVEKYWQAIQQLKSKSPTERTAGLATLKASADLEFTHAQVTLANCYLTGFNGIPKDPRKAANLFRLAAERGNAFGMVGLGVCYFMGEGVGKDHDKSLQWLTAALAPQADFTLPVPPAEWVKADLTASGDADVAGTLGSDPVSDRQATAHSILGVLYTEQKKLPEAQAHFVAAATAGPNGQSGIYAAAVAAAVNYAFGQGVPRDMAKASEMLDRSRTLSTRMGVALVQNSVAMKYTDSFAAADVEEQLKDSFGQLQSGVQLNIAQSLADKKSKTYDLAEAVKWYEVAAENGQVWAMLPLAFIYVRGELGHAEPEKAFKWFEKAGSGESPKHYLATANLAICYQNGIGTPKDPAKAEALFKKWRNLDIVCYLGSIGQCPPAPLTYEEVLALNETWAKSKKDPQAQFLLGLRYRNGWGVKVDNDEALSWLRKAAKKGHAEALNQLGEMSEAFIAVPAQDWRRAIRDAVDYYEQASAAGSPAGMANYARRLAGNGPAKDVAKAEVLYLQCLQLDPSNIPAHSGLAVIKEKQLRAALAAHDDAAAASARAVMLEHYEAAQKLGDTNSASNLGILYYQGELVPKDYRKAYACFDAAAAKGSGTAHYALGLMHEQGEGVPVTYTEAAYHYRLAALDGNTEALRRLINFYLTGQGVSPDLDQAAFWLLRMAQMTQSQKVFTVYCDVMLKKQAYENAVPLLIDLRNSTDPAVAGFAYDRLSTCYASGLGVKADPVQAKRYEDRAVALGNGDAVTKLALTQLKEGKTNEALANLRRAAPTSRLASYQLGVMYYNGENVPKNEVEGVKYLTTAAESNLTRALMFLANLTYQRSPAAPTLEQAIQYAQRAESNGNTEAPKLREELEKRRRDG